MADYWNRRDLPGFGDATTRCTEEADAEEGLAEWSDTDQMDLDDFQEEKLAGFW